LGSRSSKVKCRDRSEGGSVWLRPPTRLPHETHGLPQAIITGQLAQCHVADGAILHIYRQHRPRPEGCFVYGVVVPIIVYL